MHLIEHPPIRPCCFIVFSNLQRRHCEEVEKRLTKQSTLSNLQETYNCKVIHLLIVFLSSEGNGIMNKRDSIIVVFVLLRYLFFSRWLQISQLYFKFGLPLDIYMKYPYSRDICLKHRYF